MTGKASATDLCGADPFSLSPNILRCGEQWQSTPVICPRHYPAGVNIFSLV